MRTTLRTQRPDIGARCRVTVYPAFVWPAGHFELRHGRVYIHLKTAFIDDLAIRHGRVYIHLSIFFFHLDFTVLNQSTCKGHVGYRYDRTRAQGLWACTS